MNDTAIVWDVSSSNVKGDDSVDYYWSDCDDSLLHLLRHRASLRSLTQRLAAEKLYEWDSIAVAIPEGPWLALSVLAVANSNNNAVLIPMDPTEGIHRLAHILADCQPALVLVVHPKDQHAIQTALMTNDSIIDYENPTIIWNIKDVVTELLDASSSSSLGNGVPKLISSNNENNNDTSNTTQNRISHIVYTSGSTGTPKGCVSSTNALTNYIRGKNALHGIISQSRVLLASTLSFDPCISDILATWAANATLVLAPRCALFNSLSTIIRQHQVTHVLCTPTLWNTLLVQGGVNNNDDSLPSLERVFLGGEAIPASIRQRWARKNAEDPQKCRLFACYGVTEACVYQTAGEVFRDDNNGRPKKLTVNTNVGRPFPGVQVWICNEQHGNLLEERELGVPGEVVLAGVQVDEFSGYRNLPDLTASRFGRQGSTYYYRTGDLGVMMEGSCLKILGRINGHDTMVKFNGVRIELGEIEAALVDQDNQHKNYSVVVDAMVRLWEDDHDSAAVPAAKELVAYIVLSAKCRQELGLVRQLPETGTICTCAPLLTLLISRCRQMAKVTPTSFVLIPQIPLSPTGKRYRPGLPPLQSATVAPSFVSVKRLSEHGRAGKMLEAQLVDCLNLRNNQQALLTADTSFAMLGGDSLAATRITRALYARHHDIQNSRRLGGEFGTLDGPFAAIHLLKAKTLSEYVDFLDTHGICQTMIESSDTQLSAGDASPSFATVEEQHEYAAHEEELYDSLMETASKSFEQLACALLASGAAPNLEKQQGRLGKVGTRNEQRALFKSSPLHLACSTCLPLLVDALLVRGAELCTPDASGLFPLHLAAGRDSSVSYQETEDVNRAECVRRLLDAGAPLTMKAGNKQTVVHAAARAGNVITLKYCLDRWVRTFPPGYAVESGLDWRDRWGRTAVHWAVLNGHIECLRVLLEFGCNPNPPKAKIAKRSSAAAETPIEICRRVHQQTFVGDQMTLLLVGKGS